AAGLQEAEQEVRPILEAVRKRGDKALIEYAKKCDDLDRNTVLVPKPELKRAEGEVSLDFKAAVQVASNNIRSYARLQLPKPFRKALSPGVRLGQIVRPLDCVAAYVPSGRFPLPSTLLMTAVPDDQRRIAAA